jgi:pentatricopeptide repeat protein
MSLKRFSIRFSALVACILHLVCVVGMAQEAPSEPVSTDQLYYDAVKARMLGDDKQSEALLKQVIAAKPDEPAPYYDLSKLAFKVNNPDKAADYIKKAIALDGKNKWYHEHYANVLALRSDYSGAADEYAGIAKTEKYNNNYLEKSALLYQRAGKYKEALAQLEILKTKDRDNDEVLMQEQQIYLKMNDLEGAARVGRELIERNPKDSRFYSMLIDVYENNKQPAKAKEVLAEMQRKFPTDPSLLLTLANQALKEGDTVTYNSYVRKTITNKELDAETQLQLLGPYLGALGSDSLQQSEALQLIEQIVLQHPESVDVLMAYGRILSFNDKPDEAALQYQKAIALNPNNYNAWQQMLYALSGPADADSLIRWSEKAARLFPNHAMVHYFNGLGHFNKKEYSSAIRSINRAIDLQPEEKADELSSMHTTLGDIYNVTKEYARSDSSYDAALRLNPRNATLLNNYAYYLSLRNVRLSDAEKMSRESLRIRPGEGTFLDTYGWILYQQGKFKDALDYIRKAVAANPNETDPSLWEHLGAAEYKAGNKDAAIAAWKKAKEKGSTNIHIDKMIAEHKLYE